MASPRRVGAETSKTRDVLLDCVERLMLETGYASVTYRAVATKALTFRSSVWANRHAMALEMHVRSPH